MPAKKLTAKRAAKAELHKVKTVTVTITVEASEETLQRLAALMLLSDPTKPLPELEDLGPLPWEAIPVTENPRPLELDYELIRKSILLGLEPYRERFGLEQTKDVLMRHGGARIRDVPDENLLGLLAEVEGAVA